MIIRFCLCLKHKILPKKDDGSFAEIFSGTPDDVAGLLTTLMLLGALSLAFSVGEFSGVDRDSLVLADEAYAKRNRFMLEPKLEVGEIPSESPYWPISFQFTRNGYVSIASSVCSLFASFGTYFSLCLGASRENPEDFSKWFKLWSPMLVVACVFFINGVVFFFMMNHALVDMNFPLYPHWSDGAWYNSGSTVGFNGSNPFVYDGTKFWQLIDREECPFETCSNDAAGVFGKFALHQSFCGNFACATVAVLSCIIVMSVVLHFKAIWATTVTSTQPPRQRASQDLELARYPAVAARDGAAKAGEGTGEGSRSSFFGFEELLAQAGVQEAEAVKKGLKKAGLDLKIMGVFAEAGSTALLAQELEKAGVESGGERLRIIHALAIGPSGQNL